MLFALKCHALLDVGVAAEKRAENSKPWWVGGSVQNDDRDDGDECFFHGPVCDWSSAVPMQEYARMKCCRHTLLQRGQTPESKVAAHRGGERRNRRGFVEAGQLKNVAEKGLVAASIGGAGEGKTMCIGRSGGEGTGGIGGRQPQDSSGHQPRVRGQQAGTFVCASWEEVLLCVQEAV